MPFFKLDEMPNSVVAPGHSTAHGPTITGNELEIGYYTEPKGTGAKPHHHKSEQMMLVLAGRLRMRVGDEVRDIGPGEVALILSDQEHEQTALEESTRFVSFRLTKGQTPKPRDTTWFGLLAPAGTLATIVNKINAEMKRAIADADFKKYLESIGMEPASSTPKELGDMIRSELARWTKVIRDAGIQPN